MNTGIGILITKACNAKCDICCFDCGPDSKEHINLKLAKEFISSTSGIKEIKTIAFTGGEAFFHYDRLKELMKASLLAGKKSTVITNGFWADSVEHVKEKLRDLKQLGLSMIGISYDEFHLKYINPANIKNLIIAARENNIPVELQTAIMKETDYKFFDKLGDYISGITVVFNPCECAGRAKKRINSQEFIRDTCVSHCYCKTGNIVIDTDGNIWPCCSPFVFETDLMIGNIRDLSVSEILHREKNHLILKVLKDRGFDYFIDIAKNKLHMELPDRLINSCELCSLLFNKENIHKFVLYTYADFMKCKNIS